MQYKSRAGMNEEVNSFPQNFALDYKPSSGEKIFIIL